MSSVFEVCKQQHGSDLSVELLQCVSDAAEGGRDEISSGLNSFFLIYAGALVFFMQLGFAMLCAGSIREKNVKNVLLWNLLDSAGGAFGFWSIGFAFAYGGQDIDKGTTFIGDSGFFLTGGTDMEFWFFQYTFACALSSIVAGTIAERTKMMAYLCYSIFLCGFVYPVCAHAFWSSNGFLSAAAAEPLWGSGVIDFAGSGPVHMCGGVAALVMAIILGPRRGRFYDDDGVELEEPKQMGPHSVTLQFLGTFALWFGWYGFNPGSSLAIASTAAGDVSSLAAVNTTLGAAAAALSGMFTSTIVDERKTGVHTWDTTAAMNGCLTGLVAVTAGCATIEPWAAFVIGIFAGWIYLAASALMLRLRIDDAVDAIPVHLFGGMWGVIATGLFTSPGRLETAFNTTENVGWFYEWARGSGNFTLLGCQLVSVLFVIGWTACIFTPFCMVLKLMNWLRIDPLEEEVGMDISRHKGPAYDMDGSAKSDAVDKLNSSRRNLMSGSGRGNIAHEESPKPEPEMQVKNNAEAESVNDA
jgi:Amt family ammonium transporter